MNNNQNIEVLENNTVVEPTRNYIEKLNLKFNATKVDEIEKQCGRSIEECISDNTINNLAMFIQKGLIDGNGIHGVSRSVALSVIDKYTEVKDKDDLLFDIVEALTNNGFLSRALDVEAMRAAKLKSAEKVKQGIENIM